MATPTSDDPATAPRRVALALGSGGARGYAHIGVIDVLAERGFEIVALAGSSMGALVGGLHAAGALGPYVEWVRTLTQRDVIRYLDPAIAGAGAIRAERVFSRVFELVGDVQIEMLPIAFTAVATDLLAGREVWLQDGPLGDAMRASVAIPGLITPVSVGDRVLADGGILNPVPVSAVPAVPADLVVAVSLLGERGAGPQSPVRGAAARRIVDGWRDRLRPGLAHEAAAPGTSTQVGLLDVLTLSLDAMQAQLSRCQLAGNSPDVLITVPKDVCRTGDFHRAEEMIALGRQLALDALDRIPAGRDPAAP